MIASAKTTQGRTWLARLIVSLTIGLMLLAMSAATAFAGTRVQATHVAGNAAPVISTGGDEVSFDDDCDDEDDDDDCEEGGGGLPATDTAPLAVTGVGIATGGQLTFDDDCDDEDDDDDCEESVSGGMPATDTAPLASSSDAGTPIPAIVLLVIAGLAGGAVTVAARRSI